nr:MAG TPA: hypothetical protein [Caudoviricetes sp.]
MNSSIKVWPLGLSKENIKHIWLDFIIGFLFLIILY